MITIISSLSSFALSIIENTGYWGIFLMSFLETIVVPIPSELIITFAGFLASLGKLNFWLIVFVSTLGNLLGSIIIFYIGKTGGRWILEKYGGYILVHEKDLAVGDRWFKKHGAQAVFWGRMIPAVRSFISLPAGIANMNLSKFLSFSFLGASIWTFLMAFIGLKTGENWRSFEKYLDRFEIFGAVLLGLLAAYYIFNHLKNKHIKV